MNSVIKAVMLAAAAILLLSASSCDPQIIYRTQLISPADHLLMDCDVASPPSKEQYKLAGEGVTPEQAADKREELLSNHAMAQFKNIGACNVRWQELREWKKKQEQLQKDADAKKGK